MVSDDGASSRRALLTGTGTALAGGALALAGCGSVDTGKQAVKQTALTVRQRDIQIAIVGISRARATAYVGHTA